MPGTGLFTARAFLTAVAFLEFFAAVFLFFAAIGKNTERAVIPEENRHRIFFRAGVHLSQN
jgi:hypothetical protein